MPVNHRTITSSPLINGLSAEVVNHNSSVDSAFHSPTSAVICHPVPDKFVLVTGGAGYIGSHTVLELLENGHEVVVVDNLCNSDPGMHSIGNDRTTYINVPIYSESLRRVEQITNRKVHFHQVSICDQQALDGVFSQYKGRVWAVIHFAGLKSVSDSMSDPVSYYTTNVTGTIILLNVMEKHKVSYLVFSSSATVYGQPNVIPIPETHTFGPTNPYGRSKLVAEEIIRDTCNGTKRMDGSGYKLHAALLRYFNPIGAHQSGLIGEDPRGKPNNLMPYVSQVVVGRRPFLPIHGNDYDTPDGTGIRDFIHVVDLATGHLAALEHLRSEKPSCVAFNMGTGTGYSVLDVVRGMEKASGKQVPIQIGPRRPGDVGHVVADPSKAVQQLCWHAGRSIEKMCEDSWRWQMKNPLGYSTQNTAVGKQEEGEAYELESPFCPHQAHTPKTNINVSFGQPVSSN
ncbi:UDP-glucose 4-epimerase [Cladochytrium replicatum]|nr:UDP-glucose 4-epimerase [Cladochytrium replicatum]